jgi:DNA (cytosine-5)-methyltransferase 1
MQDPRASTLGQYLRVLEDTLPSSFLLENVEGLGFKGKDDGLQFIKRELQKINSRQGTHYSASVAVLNSADFGVPQIRKRLFIVGSKNGREFVFPSPTHTEPGGEQAGRMPWMTAWDALHDAPSDVSSQLKVKGKWADLLPTIPEGQNYLWHTDRGGGLPLFGWRRRYWSFLQKLSKRLPSWTIQAQPGPATGPFHWDNRRLSAFELCRLQTFPREFIFATDSILEAQRQIGNAVPSLLAEVLAREIRRQYFQPTRKPIQLAIQRSPYPPPAAKVKASVPAKFRVLEGEHAAHPGTGLGVSARSRAR